MIKKSKSTKKEPTPIAEYDSGPFVNGQSVIVLNPIEFNEEYLVDERGESLDDNTKNNIKKTTEDINKLIEKRELTGTVYDTEENYICLNLGKEYSFTHAIYPLDICFPDRKTFYYFLAKDVGGIKSEKKEQNSIISFFEKNNITDVEKKCIQIGDLREEITRMERSIGDYVINITRQRRDAIQRKKILDCKKKEVESMLNGQPNDYESYYNSIFKNKAVKKLDIVKYDGEESLLVTTNDLEFSDEITHLVGRHPFNYNVKNIKFNIGGYKFILTPSGNIKATNYTKFLTTRRRHPCVDSGFNVCTGDAFGRALKQSILSGDYASAIHLTINFLRRPDTTNPYEDPANFALAQDVNIKVENELDWFNGETYDQLVWSREKYKEDLQRLTDEGFGKSNPVINE